MSKWLAKFSQESAKSHTDSMDTMDSMSTLSVRETRVSEKKRMLRAEGYGCSGCQCKTYKQVHNRWMCEGCGLTYDLIGGTRGPLPIQ